MSCLIGRPKRPGHSLAVLSCASALQELARQIRERQELDLAEGEELGSNLLRAVHSSCRYPGGPDLDREIGEPPGGVSRPSRAVPLGFEITPYQPDR